MNKASTKPCHPAPPAIIRAQEAAATYSTIQFSMTDHRRINSTSSQLCPSCPPQHGGQGHSRARSSSALALASGPAEEPRSTRRAGWSQAALLAPRAAAHTATQTQQHRLGQRDRHSPRLLASKFSYALGNGSRLDPVCSRRNSPEIEKCSQQTGRAMKGRQELLRSPGWSLEAAVLINHLPAGIRAQTPSCHTPAQGLRPLWV